MIIDCLPQHLTARVRSVPGERGGPTLLAIGDTLVGGDDALDCGSPAGVIAAAGVLAAAQDFERLTEGSCSPPLAAVLYRVSGQASLLDRYFPLATVLDPAERAAFHAQMHRVGRHAGLDLRLFGEARADLTDRLPDDARYIASAHIVELFFFRPDILERFLASPRHISLYATPQAFTQDGGVGGGCYNPADERLQLVLSRLYEGFYGPVPGVAPFVHELGHLLDCMEVGADGEERCVGLLPGLRRTDGPLFTPRARALFLDGKRLEAERYRRFRQAGSDGAEAPVGHPYVFQSDGEFLAGNLELFVRTPHYFAAQNPTLFEALVVLLGQDPRHAWERDFPFYVDENRKAYAPGHEPWPDTGITVPEA